MEENLEELAHDVNIINKLKQFDKALNDIESVINTATDPKLPDKLTNNEKIKLNTLLSFSLNSLYWMNLRAEGVDPKNHEINAENDRLKKMMIRAQEVSASKKPAPRLNTDAAKRFIRSSLWTPNSAECVDIADNNEKNTKEQSMDAENDDEGFEMVC